jgi:hypothetical protein
LASDPAGGQGVPPAAWQGPDIKNSKLRKPKPPKPPNFNGPPNYRKKFALTGRLVKLLEVRPLKYIGVISYGIYMYQGLFLSTGPNRNPEQTWPPSQEIGFVLLLLSAPLSYHYFEKPFLRLKDRYAGSKTTEYKP